MTEKEISELMLLESVATKGPWRVSEDARRWVCGDVDDSLWKSNRNNDAAFVSAARNKISRLLDEWRWMREALLAIDGRNQGPYECDSLGTQGIVIRVLRQVGKE